VGIGMFAPGCELRNRKTNPNLRLTQRGGDATMPLLRN
jgi:hypothetical protein